jgi:hypothetical protein
MKKTIVLLALAGLVLALAPTAQADTVVQTSSADLNLTGRDVLAAVNFYDPVRIGEGQRTVGTIQGVDFDDFRTNVDDTGSPIALSAGAAGATLSTVISQSAGREFNNPALFGTFTGPDATEAENLANAGAYFQDSVGATLTFAFGRSYEDTDVDVQMLGGGNWARTDRTGELVMSVDGVELGGLEDRGTPDLLTFLATTDGSGNLVIDIENALSDLNTTDLPDTLRRYTMLTGTIVTMAAGPPPPTATPRPPTTAVEDWEIYN